ncbi:serine-rich adhesin for platelets-like isoform X2 [Ochlerotatus camptorhynchus]|uniref:serine-rich adhesin for platelets-like isoform X2 n=1 Tax=Ochlerotatus camptorhynchus TaxID=644619 RepID=UPI0031D2B462
MSDLCTLGSHPGMECVPLRSPADPYHYHHVTDQTKSLQELQNEVGALLEFRDLVIETFPDLKTKMASSAANSTLTGIPSSSLASRREWEPGIRSRRKLTYKESTSVASSAAAAVAAAATAVASSSSSAELHQHSSSSLIRSRSNSHSGKKEPKSGEGNNGSVVIQDSGFSTETSSSKETHSASSTTGGATNSGGSSSGSGGLVGQGTIVSNTPNRLTVDTEDELWNLLDVIHRKSNRLREEVDALQQLEREKYRTNQLNNSSNSNSNNNNNNNINNHTTVVSSTSNINNIVNHSSSSRSSSGSSGSSGNLPQTHQPPGVRSANGSVVAVGGGGSLAKTFQNQLLVDIVNKDDVQILRKERDRLFDKLSEFETEAIASRIRTSKMQDEVDALALAKRELEDQLKAALSQKLELNSRIHDLHQQFANKSAPSSPDSIKSRHQLTPGLRKHSSSDSTTSTIIVTPSSHLSTSPSSGSQSTTPATHLLKPRFSQSSFAPVKSVSSSSNNSNSSNTKVPVPTVPSAVIAASAVELQQEEIAELGKLDGLVSSPARLSKVRMTDSKKIAAILLETNIVELQRHLLTITVQNQVLQQRLDHATRSRIFLSKKLDKSKEDMDDLKFKLEEKTIELEGTKAQLRVLESKQSGKSSSSSGFSPEHHHHHGSTTTSPLITSAGAAASATSTMLKGPTASTTSVVVTTSAGGIVSHQHRSASTSELAQLSPVHQLHHHQQLQQQRDLALRLAQSQVSTPSMKAMTPLAMDEIQQHSSSTESAQDQAERDSPGRLQCPETPRRRPSKIPLAGTKGYVAPKPPSGRNFMASQQRGEKSSPSPSASLTNKSLNKSTGSLNMKSTGPSSITSANKDKKDVSLNRPESAQSWRRDTSLEKSRSSSIPVSKGGGGGGSPTVVKPPSVVSSSPLPKAKRDSLTTRVKNLDSLSRLQSAASASTGNLSKSSSKKDLSSSFTTGQLRDRKQSASAIRRVSSASIGRGSSSSSAAEQNNNNGSSAGATADSGPTGGSGSGDSGKARRTNTFRLAKPTLMPPLEITSIGPKSPRGRYASNLPIPRTPTAPALIITSSSPVVHHPPCSSSSSSSSSAGSSPSSVTTITTIESHSSSTAAPSRDLIAEYLAAKSRSQQAPAIFNPKLTPTGSAEEQQQLELAYKHPILLMDEEENVAFCSVVSSMGNERNREVEVKYIEDNSMELLEAKAEEMGEGEKESLIVPKPKMIAFHSPKTSPVKAVDDTDGKCRLVGRVNPNILKTWEQLSGGGSEKTYCEHKRKNSLITVTSSENSGGDKQSCLIYYRNPYEIEPDEEANGFRVMKIRHRESVSESSTTVADEEQQEAAQTTISLATSTATTTTTTSSEGCYDFYDSIDDSSSNRMMVCGRMEVDEDEDEEDEEEYALAAGEGLADFTSLDRKKLMWSIDVE